MRSRRFAVQAALTLAAASAPLWSVGCIVGDGDERCGALQTLRNGACRCAEGAVPRADGVGCEECGEHEVAESGACECAQGYARLVTGEPCVEAPEGLGKPCSDPADCPDDFPLCSALTEKPPHCTRSCAADDDCEGAFVCSRKDDGRICTAPPSGNLQTCSSPDSCVGLDASYCNSFLMACVIADCGASGDSRCPGSLVCCDFREYGVPSQCVDGSAATEGCPLGVPLLETGP